MNKKPSIHIAEETLDDLFASAPDVTVEALLDVLRQAIEADGSVWLTDSRGNVLRELSLTADGKLERVL